MHSDFSLLDTACSGASSHQVQEITPSVGADASPKGAASRAKTTQGDVGESRLNDEEREQAISRAGKAMMGWYSQYQMTGQAAHLDCAYRCLGMMRTLIAGRSAEQVARMERERGLDLPACANEGTAW